MEPSRPGPADACRVVPGPPPTYPPPPRTNRQPLEPNASAVNELRGALERDGDLVLESVRFDLLVRVIGRHDLPVAGDRLDDGHRLRLSLVVPERDLPLDLVEIRPELPEVLLRALPD